MNVVSSFLTKLKEQFLARILQKHIDICPKLRGVENLSHRDLLNFEVICIISEMFFRLSLGFTL